jgi:hypothetical protein
MLNSEDLEGELSRRESDVCEYVRSMALCADPTPTGWITECATRTELGKC